MSSLTVETKSPPTSENVTKPTFYTNEFPPSTNLPNDPFKKSADLSKKSIEDNPLSQRKPNTCIHERSADYNSNICVDCGNRNLSLTLPTRVADETHFAETAKIEDHQYLVDQLSPVLGSMQVTHSTLGKGILEEFRESNTMAMVSFDCDPCVPKRRVVIPCLELKEFKDCHAKRIHGLGITIEALIAFAYKHDCWNWPTYKVMRDIIVPATRDTRCRYADLPELKGCFGPATVFMSHCWGATFGDLIGAACHGARKDRVVWIDIFAVRQWPGNEADVHFRDVISHCDALIVSTSPVNTLKKDVDNLVAFLDSNEGKAARQSLPFFRLWCIVEIVAAILLKKPIVAKAGSVKRSKAEGFHSRISKIYEYNTQCIGTLMDDIMGLIDVDAAECTVQVDYDREMDVVRRLDVGSYGVKALIVGVVGGAATSINFNVLEIDAYLCNETESFRALNMPLGCKGKEQRLAKKVLQAACVGGRESVVNELLFKWSVKEDDDQNKEGETKRNDFMEKKKDEERKWLIQLIDDSYALVFASMAGHVGVVERILEVVGINVNVDMNGLTPLFEASNNGHTKIVKALLAVKDIDVNQAEDEDTPLDIATENNHTEIIQLLQDAGALQNEDGDDELEAEEVAAFGSNTEGQGWVAHQDPASNRTYYVGKGRNDKRRRSTWTKHGNF